MRLLAIDMKRAQYPFKNLEGISKNKTKDYNHKKSDKPVHTFLQEFLHCSLFIIEESRLVVEKVTKAILRGYSADKTSLLGTLFVSL